MLRLILLLLLGLLALAACTKHAKGHVPEQACFLKINEFWETQYEDKNLMSVYFNNPFSLPLTNQSPYCPAEDYKYECKYNQRYRTADGSCNNLINKWWGVSFSPYQRLLEPEYTVINKQFKPRLVTETKKPLPNSRLVANHLPEVIIQSGLNGWFTFFGQLVSHDTSRTQGGRSLTGPCHCQSHDNPGCFNIELTEENENKIVQCFGYPGPGICKINTKVQECIPMARSAEVKNSFDCNFESREQSSRGTHFLDLDVVYGATDDQATNIRAFKNGLLKSDKVNSAESLPVADINKCLETGPAAAPFNWKSTGCVFSGDARAGSEFTFVTIAHLLLHRSHNAVALGLSKVNPHWDDETVYQEARRILIAVYQNIIYHEYLQIAIGKERMTEFGLSPLFDGYAYNYNDHLYPNNFNEFIVAAFRLHQTVPNSIVILDANYELSKFTVNGFDVYSVDMNEMRFNQWLYFDQIETLLISFSGDSTLVTQFGMASSINHQMPLNPDNKDSDRTSLAAINIQRGRDHGIPGYGRYRHMAGGKFPSDWDDLIGVFLPDTITTLQSLYDTPNSIDLWVGLLAEMPEKGALLAKTQSWLIAKNFHSLKYGDRHYYENGQDIKNRFTPDQLYEIRHFQFASLLCLGLDDITNGDKVPEHGFFMPDILTDGYIKASGCYNDAPMNHLEACHNLPAIDFNLWKSDQYATYY